LTSRWKLHCAKLLISEECVFGDGGEVIVEEAPVSVEREALVTKAGDYRFFFSWRSDPSSLT
jgi:hypothetical protein